MIFERAGSATLATVGGCCGAKLSVLVAIVVTQSVLLGECTLCPAGQALCARVVCNPLLIPNQYISPSPNTHHAQLIHAALGATPMWHRAIGLLIAALWLLATHVRAAVVSTRYATRVPINFKCRLPSNSWAYRTPYSRPGWSGKPSTSITGDLQYTHMPQFVDLANGSLALAWQGSVLPYEGSSMQALYWSTSNDNGRSWTPPSVLRTPRNQLPNWGPVFHTNGTSITLFYSASNAQCRWGGETGQGAWSPGGDILMSVSHDDGQTWGHDRTIFSFQQGRPIPKVLANQLVVVESSGRWVLPFWFEQGGECRDSPDLHGVPGVLVSDDEVRLKGSSRGTRCYVHRTCPLH